VEWIKVDQKLPSSFLLPVISFLDYMLVRLIALVSLCVSHKSDCLRAWRLAFDSLWGPRPDWDLGPTSEYFGTKGPAVNTSVKWGGGGGGVDLPRFHGAVIKHWNCFALVSLDWLLVSLFQLVRRSVWCCKLWNNFQLPLFLLSFVKDAYVGTSHFS
jgi:hypothetical protein